jgi:hypothetical protein
MPLLCITPTRVPCTRQVLEKKKAELLAKYATEEFLSQQDEARSLLNKK